MSYMSSAGVSASQIIGAAAHVNETVENAHNPASPPTAMGPTSPAVSVNPVGGMPAYGVNNGGLATTGSNFVGGIDRGPQSSQSAWGSADGSNVNNMNPNDLNAFYDANGRRRKSNMVGGDC